MAMRTFQQSQGPRVTALLTLCEVALFVGLLPGPPHPQTAPGPCEPRGRSPVNPGGGALCPWSLILGQLEGPRVVC